MDLVQYRGAYRFADRAALDKALSAALQHNTEWLPRFSPDGPSGSSLRVDLDLPARSHQRSAAASVMQALAYLAVEGIVVARHRDLAVDVFVCGE
jgi:hypothetical protein